MAIPRISALLVLFGFPGILTLDVSRRGNGTASVPKLAVTIHGKPVREGNRSSPPTSNLNSTLRLDAQQAGSAGMIHLLFLVGSDISHLDLWTKWIAHAPPGTYTAHIHCKDQAACHASGVMNFPGMKMVPTTPTWYCHDLVTAMVQLLRYALSDSENTNATSGYPMREKYVFISDSTLPVKPYHEVYSALVLDDDSDFCVFPKWQWASANIDGHSLNMVKHHQWLTLNRAHARLFVDKWVPVDARGVWHVWLKDKSWQGGNERYVSPHHFYHPPRSNSCPDEWAFIATIFGAIEPDTGMRTLPSFGGGPLHTTGPEADVTQGRCRTFVFWTYQDGPAFASIGNAIHNDWGNSYISCYPQCVSSPASFTKLSMQGLQVLRHSEFLFARKIPGHATLPDYEKIVIR